MAVIARRALHAFVVVFGVTTVVFFVTRVVSDPARLRVAIEATAEDYEAVQRDLGLDGAILEQYGDYLGGLVSLDFGDSFSQHRPASDVVAETLPRTLQLVALALPLTLVVSITLGVLAALRPGGLLDRFLVSTSLLGVSIPPFLVGLLLVMVFSVNLGWLPTSGTGGFDHMVLPVLTLALASTGRLTMLVRSSMIDELSRPWISVAKAKGARRWRIVGVHALRNAAVAITTLAGWEFITLLAGYAVVVEFIFAWPGMGQAALVAATKQDLPVVQAIVLLMALIVVAVNLLIDVVYTVIDPRIRMQ